MASLERSRTMLAGFPGGALLLAVLGGCSHPLEVDVPPSVHGRVTVMCDSFRSSPRPILVNEDGIAPHAACPPSVQSLVVVRGGQPIKPSAAPRWSTTGDGILLAVEFDLP